MLITYYKGLRTTQFDLTKLEAMNSINGAHFFMTTSIELARAYGNNILAITIDEEFDLSRTRTIMNDEGELNITETIWDKAGLNSLLINAWDITINNTSI